MLSFFDFERRVTLHEGLITWQIVNKMQKQNILGRKKQLNMSSRT